MGHALRFISGRYQGGEIVLPEDGEMIIGRATELDLVLAEDMVSRKHAKLTAQAGALTIADLGSTNGTFLNGEKIQTANLKHHDRVLIGTSILKIIDTDELTTHTAERNDVKAMMERLADRASDSATMSGDLTEVPLPDLLQLFATNQKSGILTLSGSQRAKLYIQGGQLICASLLDEPLLPPMKALCRILMWESGAFVLGPWEDNLEFVETLTAPTESLLMEALRQMDELKRLQRDLPPPEAQLHLCVPMTPKLSALTARELDTLQIAINFTSVKDIVDRAPATDFEVYTHLHKFIMQGYLEVA